MINPADVSVLDAARVNSSAKSFLFEKARTTVNVRVDSADGTEFIEIPIYLKLTKREIADNSAFLNTITKEEVTNEAAAHFLATITVDSELDDEFWLSEDLDTGIAEKVITVYMQSVIKQYENIKKFRRDR